MCRQVLEHTQRSLDDISNVVLQPRHRQLLDDQGHSCDAGNTLWPLVSIAAVHDTLHELVDHWWVCAPCTYDAASASGDLTLVTL